MMDKVKEKMNRDYLKSEVSKIEDGDLDLVMKNKEAIDKKISGAGFKKYTELGKLMMGMLSDYKKGDYKTVPWFTISATVLALLYIFNPLDMVPDFIPGVGYVDDFALLTVVMRFIETDLHSYLDWKLKESKA